MNTTIQNTLAKLDSLAIGYLYKEHEALPTVEDALFYWKEWEAVACKNLFLRNKKGDRHFLIVLQHDTVFSIKLLKHKFENQHLSFASEQRMQKYLGVKPGSVSPLGLMNDEQNEVELLMDLNLKNATKMLFHPNDNTATIEISFSDLMHFLKDTGHEINWMDFSEL
jgi:Ala-tRNA(Pro) deacylase